MTERGDEEKTIEETNCSGKLFPPRALHNKITNDWEKTWWKLYVHMHSLTLVYTMNQKQSNREQNAQYNRAFYNIICKLHTLHHIYIQHSKFNRINNKIKKRTSFSIMIIERENFFPKIRSMNFDASSIFLPFSF